MSKYGPEHEGREKAVLRDFNNSANETVHPQSIVPFFTNQKGVVCKVIALFVSMNFCLNVQSRKKQRGQQTNEPRNETNLR